MIQFPQIFLDANQLFIGTNYEYIAEYRTFLHTKSVFNDEWYNFVVPKVEKPDMLETDLVEKVIKNEEEQGVKVSYYVLSEYAKGYLGYLGKKGFNGSVTDSFQVYETASELEIDEVKGYEITTDYNLDKLTKLMVECFPDWENEADYVRYYEDLKNNSPTSRIFETFVIKNENGEIVSASYVTVDKNIGIAYFHNTGTKEEHRGLGLQKLGARGRINFVLDQGVNRVFTITEPESTSFENMKKLGFEEQARFRLFYR